jgi:hypothetical protein
VEKLCFRKCYHRIAMKTLSFHLRDAETGAGSHPRADRCAMALGRLLSSFDHDRDLEHLIDGGDRQGKDDQDVDFACSFQTFQIAH